jgi:hypothetical protein
MAGARRLWRENNPDRVKAIRARTAGKYPERLRARKLLQAAVADGRIQRQPCEVCAREKAHGHHDDYAKPYDVRWLCHRCHMAHHREMKKAATTFAA